ncbi:zinc carboxypeptidase [Nitzschia inconspicua]|uniref:Zinc carboxypeptidase n=1 Tax=Nitzschia inconspicua TaxID=303405 RepID=A0A9K3L943_9STRA|nr:zinc carboxypeptidase [Nitzschia inconspicua]
MHSPLWSTAPRPALMLFLSAWCTTVTFGRSVHAQKADTLHAEENVALNRMFEEEPNPRLQQRQRHLQQQTTLPQKDVKDYELWDASEFPKALEEWARKYPDMIHYTTAQEAYNLPAAGSDTDCPFYPKTGCPNYFFTIQDFLAHPVDSDSSANLPEVFWSGCLHGNERVGPTSVMEAAALLLEAAHCEAMPQRNNKGSSLISQLSQAKQCRQSLRNKGIDDVHRKWLARLVATRRIVVAPTANALGYFRNDRTENGIDPNRDFPYDLEDSSMCMQTIAGRTLNEIYQEHMFQLALTFHAGMEVVAYEWGAPSWLNHLAPDDEAQQQIGAGYSRYGGGWSKSKPYKYGTMNDLVYFVRGGMEDWAYAGSWTKEKVTPCTPKQFGGYPELKTTYNNSTLRVFNMLIETSNAKTPKKSELGTSLDVLERSTTGNGHVSRNIRLALLATEMVQPYAAIVAVNQLPLSDDVVPMMKREPTSCLDNKAVMVAKNARIVDVEWTIGGAMTVDKTELLYAKWDDVGDVVDCWTPPTDTARFQKAQSFQGIINGTGFFSVRGSHPSPEQSLTGLKPSLGPLFRATIPLDAMKQGDKIIVLASAMVDQSWKAQPKNVAPNIPPQSHIVNARTDPSYHHESNGKHIHGHVDWYSLPLTIIIGDFDDSVGTRDEDLVNTIELHPRYGDRTSTKGGTKPKAANTDQLWFPVSFWIFLAVGLLLLAGTVYCIRTCCTRQYYGKVNRKSSEELEEAGDDFVFEAKPYSDRVDAEYGDEYDDEDGIEIPQIS